MVPADSFSIRLKKYPGLQATLRLVLACLTNGPVLEAWGLMWIWTTNPVGAPFLPGIQAPAQLGRKGRRRLCRPECSDRSLADSLSSGAHPFVLLLLAVPLGSLLRGLLLLSDGVALVNLHRLRRGRKGYQDGKGDETKHDGPDLHEDGPMLAADGREHQTQ